MKSGWLATPQSGQVSGPFSERRPPHAPQTGVAQNKPCSLPRYQGNRREPEQGSNSKLTKRFAERGKQYYCSFTSATPTRLPRTSHRSSLIRKLPSVIFDDELWGVAWDQQWKANPSRSSHQVPVSFDERALPTVASMFQMNPQVGESSSSANFHQW